MEATHRRALVLSPFRKERQFRVAKSHEQLKGN